MHTSILHESRVAVLAARCATCSLRISPSLVQHEMTDRGRHCHEGAVISREITRDLGTREGGAIGGGGIPQSPETD